VSELKVTWIGQGGYILDYSGTTLVLDPYFSNSVEATDGFKRLFPAPEEALGVKADYILITHDHLDHFDEESLALLFKNKKPVVVGPDSCLEHLRRFDDSIESIALNRGTSFAVGDLTIRAVPAEHTDDSVGFLMQKGAGGVYFTGDTLYTKELAAVKAYGPKVLFVCINGKLGNMTASEAARLATELEVEEAYPNHYGLFAENTADPGDFCKELEGTQVRPKVLELMESVVIPL